MKDLFTIFYQSTDIDVDDQADFQVTLMDTKHPDQAAMAVTALTLNMLAKSVDLAKIQVLLYALDAKCAKMVRIRAMVGLIWVYTRLDIRDEWALDALAEAISLNPELAFEAWTAILRTRLTSYATSIQTNISNHIQEILKEQSPNGPTDAMKYIQQQAKKYKALYEQNLDLNYAVFKESYHGPQFQNNTKLWFVPFRRHYVDGMTPEQWTLVNNIIKDWNLCDSDKYAFLQVFNELEKELRKELPPEAIESMVDGHMLARPMMPTPKSNPVNNYVRQLYRFITLSPTSNISLSPDTEVLTHSMAAKMLTVGEKQHQIVDQILSFSSQQIDKP